MGDNSYNELVLLAGGGWSHEFDSNPLNSYLIQGNVNKLFRGGINVLLYFSDIFHKNLLHSMLQILNTDQLDINHKCNHGENALFKICRAVNSDTILDAETIIRKMLQMGIQISPNRNKTYFNMLLLRQGYKIDKIDKIQSFKNIVKLLVQNGAIFDDHIQEKIQNGSNITFDSDELKYLKNFQRMKTRFMICGLRMRETDLLVKEMKSLNLNL
jgi:hypothetical protein